MELWQFKFPDLEGCEGVVWSYENVGRLVEVGGSRFVNIDHWENNTPVIVLYMSKKSIKGIRVEDGAVTKPTNPKDAVGINKVSFSVIPANVLGEVAVALTEGALKYGKHNYRGVGVRSSVYYDASLRHLTAWWEGEDIDPESGLSHITKAITGLMVLRDCMMRGNFTDDRPPKSNADWMVPLNEHTVKLRNQYKDRNPKHFFEKE